MFLCFIATLCCLVPWATSHQHSNRRYLGNFIVMNFFWLLSIWQSKWYKNAKYHELKSFFYISELAQSFDDCWMLLNAFWMLCGNFPEYFPIKPFFFCWYISSEHEFCDRRVFEMLLNPVRVRNKIDSVQGHHKSMEMLF